MRASEALVKRRVVEVSRVLVRRGASYAEVAERLGGPSARTLRSWFARWRADRLAPRLRGRPPRELTGRERAVALGELERTGGRMGRDALCAALPTAPVRALRHLARCVKAAERRRAVTVCGVLDWKEPGRVMAADLTDVPPAALGRLGKKLFYARDLGARLVHDPVPLATKSEGELLPVLDALFAREGAPLVLKIDNEGALRGKAARDLFRRHGVVVLYSPPRCPSYNGSAEAGIGAQKARAQKIALLAGRPGAWLLEDVVTAQLETNHHTRPFGARGPTPAERYAARTPITADERQLFRDTVAAALREARRRRATLSAEHQPGRRDRASALMRSAVTSALTQLGYLEIRRRRITPVISNRKAARIT